MTRTHPASLIIVTHQLFLTRDYNITDEGLNARKSLKKSREIFQTSGVATINRIFSIRCAGTVITATWSNVRSV